jgi:hypothetical protein
MQHESGDGGIEVVYRSAEDIETAQGAQSAAAEACLSIAQAHRSE